MNKKEYVLKVLESLRDFSPIAANILVLLKTAEVNEETIDGIIGIFGHTLKNMDENEQKDKLNKALQIFENIKRLEEDSQKQDAKDIQTLEKLINDL